MIQVFLISGGIYIALSVAQLWMGWSSGKCPCHKRKEKVQGSRPVYARLQLPSYIAVHNNGLLAHFALIYVKGHVQFSGISSAQSQKGVDSFGSNRQYEL